MTGRSPRSGGHRQSMPVITDARAATSAEMAGRMKRYAITMGFRTACFLAMIFVPGALRWVLFACAVFLPYVAVVFANQAHTRTGNDSIPTAAATHARQLPAGPPDAEVISGDIVGDRGQPDPAAETHGQPRNDRVA